MCHHLYFSVQIYNSKSIHKNILKCFKYKFIRKYSVCPTTVEEILAAPVMNNRNSHTLNCPLLYQSIRVSVHLFF